MRIVLDAMGTDTHPAPDVAGAILAAGESLDTVILVGDEGLIRAQLDRQHAKKTRIEIVHAPEAISMADKPSLVGKSKPASSMHVGMSLVRDGQADAFVTAGNTGAAHAIAMLFTLHRIPGIKRPALSAIFPFNNRPITFLDIGANTDSKPEWLAQYALMGSIYAQNALGVSGACVGLLSNGEEEGKGTELIRQAGQLLAQMPIRFVGNIEPKELMRGDVDVLVCDGFTGNILIKTFEASTRYLAGVIRDELKRNVVSGIGGLLARPAFQRARRRIDTAEIGGAPLLGVNGVVIIAHGRSDAFAIKNALLQARKAVQGRVIEAIRENIALYNTAHLQTEGQG